MSHKLVKTINKKKTIYCSLGHFIKFKNNEKLIRFKKNLFRHQIKKEFQFSLEWEKNQIAIWDNRSMLHKATSFKGDRKMQNYNTVENILITIIMSKINIIYLLPEMKGASGGAKVIYKHSSILNNLDKDISSSVNHLKKN